MAINMLNESEYITCPKCNGMVFKEGESFALKRTQTPTGEKLKKYVVNKIYLCAKCNESVTDIVKKYEIM